MAEFVWIRTNIEGVRAVLKSGGVQAQLASITMPIAEAATANAQEPEAVYKSYVDVGEYTALGKVVCGNQAARRDNAHHNTILKSR